MRIVKDFTLISLMVILLLLPGSAAKGQDLVDSMILIETNQPISNNLTLIVDGVETLTENPPLKIAYGRTMITLTALQNIIPCQSEWGSAGELLIIREQYRLQISPGKAEMLVNSLSQTLEVAPFVNTDGNLLLPLQPVGEALGYKVIYDPLSQSILLNSPGYQPPPPAVVDPVQALPVSIDYSSLPTWGNVLSIPNLASLWKDEKLVTGYFTRLVNSPLGRTTNIILSSAKINGTILQPGEVFSFNHIVGPRTTQGGYQNAKVFAGKKVVTGIGGGICQTSSTIYNLALEAGMQVLERYPHSLKVVYAPPKRDATVSWGGADFKFRNTKNFPVKILCKVDNGYVFAVMVQADSPATTVSPPNQ